MSFLDEAFFDLMGEPSSRKLSVKYSRAFSDYNANVKYTNKELIFNLSHLWKDVSDEIKMGIVQHLLCKVMGVKKRTLYTDLYDTFLKNAHRGQVEKEIEPYLKEKFDKINDMYFAGMMDTPNLVFGGKNLSKLGSYHYASDTIMISEIMKRDEILLEYVLYHEMLHKKLKFSRSKTGNKSFHHTKEFKELEAKLYLSDAESKLKKFLNKQRVKRAFFLD